MATSRRTHDQLAHTTTHLLIAYEHAVDDVREEAAMQFASRLHARWERSGSAATFYEWILNAARLERTFLRAGGVGDAVSRRRAIADVKELTETSVHRKVTDPSDDWALALVPKYIRRYFVGNEKGELIAEYESMPALPYENGTEGRSMRFIRGVSQSASTQRKLARVGILRTVLSTSASESDADESDEQQHPAP